jgi:hypothetical protein
MMPVKLEHLWITVYQEQVMLCPSDFKVSDVYNAIKQKRCGKNLNSLVRLQPRASEEARKNMERWEAFAEYALISALYLLCMDCLSSKQKLSC